jgi:hypothetical protein
MSEARKYHLNLVVANQFTTQLSDEIRDAVFGNMGTIVSFRVGQNDVEALSKYYQPLFNGDDLLRVPNFNTIVRTLVKGVPTQPFSMATIPALGKPNQQLLQALKQLSAAKFGRPKAQVENEIFARLATKEDPRPSFGSSVAQGAPSPGMGKSPASRPTGASSGSSFLDEWLAKRRQAPPVSPATTDNPSIKPLQQKPLTNPPTGSTASAVADSKKEEPVEEHAKATETRNISSSDIENEEVASIAQELKQSLGKTEEQAKATSPVPDSPGKSAASESPQEPSLDEDTIYIDREGNLHNKNEPDS